MTERQVADRCGWSRRAVRPLPELEREAEAFGAKVEEHLRRMGVGWG